MNFVAQKCICPSPVAYCTPSKSGRELEEDVGEKGLQEGKGAKEGKYLFCRQTPVNVILDSTCYVFMDFQQI